ncbi:hypothetical protein RJ641_015885 [Dillenia turbinata]|uniref:Uncharacterized protein n=1 Tax=Dillenia turbinata TaxID=194707 RepID=A0AAN8Z0I0_9MAGN
MFTVIEQCRVAAQPGTTVLEKSLPLTSFDLTWFHLHPIQRVIFYEHSQLDAAQCFISKLKDSLSLTLKHFYMFAGHLVCSKTPNPTIKPKIHYVDGDSIPLTFMESNQDNFDYLTSYYPRTAFEFHPLVPQLPAESIMGDIVLAPLLAIQVTLFPGSGISIGFTARHEAADGNTVTRFIRSWASITKFSSDVPLLGEKLDQPICFYDRSVVNDPNEEIFWGGVMSRPFNMGSCSPTQLPPDLVRATFIMAPDHIQLLKRWVSKEFPTLSHVTTFSVTLAFVWVSIFKLKMRINEVCDRPVLLVISADCRRLMDPPLPENYFGNCLLPVFFPRNFNEPLSKDDGFIIGAKLIGDLIEEKLRKKDAISRCQEEMVFFGIRMSEFQFIGVSGSPKFAVYDADFGWGKPKKNELISIDFTGAIFLSDCRDAKGGVEVGLSFPKIEMDAFTVIFADGLKSVEKSRGEA